MFASAILVAVVSQVQLMPPEKEQRLRSYIPKLDDNQVINAKLEQAMLYDSEAIPPAHQFQPIIGGQGADYTVLYSPAAQLNGSPEPTNANNEFPWTIGSGGGLHLVPKSQRYEFKLCWLPPRPSGGVWPIVVYRRALDKSHSVNMPIPKQGWGWVFPADAILGEVLTKRFSDGTFATYEVRLRLREIDDWTFEVYRPDIQLPQFARVVTQRLADRNHDKPLFDTTATTHVLPPIPNAKQLLQAAKFVPTFGSDRIVPTADDADNIVPKDYAGHFLKDCSVCHRDTLRHADSIESRRDWYGQVSGSDGVLSFHPFEPSSIGPPDKPVRLRRELVESGVVEMYDPEKHPSSVYSEIPAYSNYPSGSYPNSGRMTLRN